MWSGPAERACVGLALVLAAASGCAKGEEPAGAQRPDAAPLAPEEPPNEPVAPSAPAETPDAAAPDAAVCTTKVVINELMAYGKAANDEFIELYNPNDCPVSLDGHRLAYKSSAGMPANGSPLHTFAAGAAIGARGFLVVGTSAFAGKKDVTFNGGGVTVNGGMANDGQVALLDAAGDKLDSVGYGGATGDYVEKAPSPKPPSTGSVARKADGVDTDDNAKDFDWVTTPTPGAPN